MQLPRRDRRRAAAPREQPAMREYDPAPLAFAPPTAAAVPAVAASMALRSLRPLPCSTRISMRVESMSSTLRCATSDTRRPAPQGDTERGLVLDAWRRFEQPRRFLNAQSGQLARISRDHQSARQIAPPQPHGEQEPQRRDCAVDRRRPHAVLMLTQLEAPNVLGRRGVGSTAKERGKAPDMTNVVLLRMWSSGPASACLAACAGEAA